MKMNFQGGAGVLASRGNVCGVPKEHLKIARHFNAGSICKWHQVPEGRQTSGHWFSRPSGTCLVANLFPALKRRAVFRKSLRDCLLFAIALILLAAFGATAQTTNDSVKAIVQGRNLALQLLEQRPTENFTNSGVLQIRDGRGKRSEIPIRFEITVTTANWQSTFKAFFTNATETLTFIHPANQANRLEGDYPDGGSINSGAVNNRIEPLDIYRHEYPESSSALSTLTVDLGVRYSQGDASLVGSGLKSTDGTMFPFAGSDFCVGDLGLEFLHWPGQKILRGDTARGRLCKVLESTNHNPSTNGYSRVLCWIDNETLGIVEAEAYDAKGKKLKEFLPKDFKKVNGQWQVGSMEIDNVQTGSRTKLELDLKAK